MLLFSGKTWAKALNGPLEGVMEFKNDERFAVEPLVAFEAIRRILGHEATLPREVMEALAGRSWVGALMGYAVRLRARRAELHNPSFNDGVLPTVDAADLEIRHVTCTGGTELVLRERWGLHIGRPKRPFNLETGRDLAIALLGMAAFPKGNWAAPEFWTDALGQPSEEAVFGAFLALRKAGFDNDEVVTMMAPAGITPDPEAIAQAVLAWDNVGDFYRRRWLHGHAKFFGDDRGWIPLPLQTAVAAE